MADREMLMSMATSIARALMLLVPAMTGLVLTENQSVIVSAGAASLIFLVFYTVWSWRDKRRLRDSEPRKELDDGGSNTEEVSPDGG
jgi:hypothetical protein